MSVAISDGEMSNGSMTSQVLRPSCNQQSKACESVTSASKHSFYVYQLLPILGHRNPYRYAT